jgi:hypothetical protein
VTAEVFANMADAKQLADAAWNKIFVMGQPLEEQINATCRQIQEAQEQ